MADETTLPARPELGEIASTGDGRDITKGYADFLRLLRPEDGVLASGGGDMKIYEMLLVDDQVKPTIQQRRMAVVSREWEVLPGGDSPADKAAAEHLAEQLQAMPFDRITVKMLAGVFYGYAVGECMWRIGEDGKVWLDDVKVRKQRRFRFGQDGELRLLTRDRPQGEAMPPAKFWTFATGADHDDDPYGLGLAHWLYWPAFFKRHGVKFWLIFLEKFGGPTAVGKYPAGAQPSDIDKLLEAVQAIQLDSGIVIPDGMMVELLEATRSGSASYMDMYEAMNAAISKVVLSQTMTTDDGSSHSQATVHMDVARWVMKADSDLICESFNDGPAAWLTAWNFPGARPPKLWRDFSDEEDLNTRAERDGKLKALGWSLSEDEFKQTYGEGYERGAPEVPDDGGDGRQPPEFAEGEDEDLIDRLARLTLDDEGWSAMLGPIEAQIAQALEGAADLADAEDRLARLLPELDTEALATMLAQALFLSRTAGEAGERLDDGG